MAGIPNRKKAISLVAISTPGDVKTYPTGTYCVPADGDGTFLLSDSTVPTQFSWSSGSSGTISYDKTTGATTITTLTASQAFVSGGLSVGNYVQLLSVGNVTIPTNQTASYIYTSGSTNDMYFTQYQPGSGYNNTTRLRWLESELSTGLLHGGILSTVTGTTTFNVSAGSGIIVSYNASTGSDPYPTIQFVNWNSFVSQSLIYSASAPITYVAIDRSGVISQTNTAFTSAQFKDRIILGRVLHQTGSVTNGTINTPTTAYGINSNTYDFIRAFGPLKISGQVIAASGSTLGLTRTAGDSYVEGRNYTTDPNSPNYILAANDPELTTTKIYYQWVSGSTVKIDTNGGSGYSAVRPAFYNLNGTVTAISPTNNKFTVQRVYWFPKSATRALYIYYGTTIYVTLADAVAAINNEPNFVEGDNTRASAVYLGAVVVEANCTDLSSTTAAQIVNAGIFRGSSGGGSGGGGGTTSPGGTTYSIQYNDAGSFNGSSNFTYDRTALTLSGNFNLVGTGTINFDGGTLTGSLAQFAIMSGSIITGSTALYTTITSSTVTGSTAIFTNITASSIIQRFGTYTISPASSVAAALTVSGSNTVGGSSYIDFLKIINTSAGALNINKTFRMDNSGSIQVVNSAYTQTIFSLENNGNINVYGGNAAVTDGNQDAISGSLRFNSNNSQIYDDGNMHIHSRNSGQSMWINTNNAPVNMLVQSPVSAGRVGTGVTMGGDGTSNGFLTVSGSKSITTAASYGYLINASPSYGTYPGGSQTINVSIYAKDRIQGQEIDALSDERMKDVQGEIPTEDAVRLVNNIKPIKYTWKDSEDKGLKTGFSAQQVIKSGFGHLVSVIPKQGMEEIIEEDGFINPKDTQFVMNYDQVVPYHNSVIKFLLEKIEKLEQTVAELQASRKDA